MCLRLAPVAVTLLTFCDHPRHLRFPTENNRCLVRNQLPDESQQFRLRMSGPSPQAAITSRDARSKRPVKRQALTPTSQQATQLTALFAKPDREIALPTSSSTVAKKNSFPAPPEIVANVQGSSAGAGSGEFHVYKASRRREYERVKLMDEEVAREEADLEFEKKREEQRKKDEEKTEKNRKRRERNKAKKGGKDGKGTETDEATTEAVKDGETSLKLKGNRLPLPEDQPGPKERDEAGLVAGTEEVGVIIQDDD